MRITSKGQVTIPIERALNNVPRVLDRRSRTIFGLAVVQLTFEDGTNDYFARQQVLERLIRGCRYGTQGFSIEHPPTKRRIRRAGAEHTQRMVEASSSPEPSSHSCGRPACRTD